MAPKSSQTFALLTAAAVGLLITALVVARADAPRVDVEPQVRHTLIVDEHVPLPPPAVMPTATLDELPHLREFAPLNGMPGCLVTGRPANQTCFAPLSVAYRADVRGDLATVAVAQVFRNNGSEPIHPTYEFPLPENAAVFDVLVRTKHEVLQAEIATKKDARERFDKAKSQGRAAALTQQHRPNVFTHSVANLGPGEAMEVTLRYTQAVPRTDGRYRLALPFTVADRYTPRQSDNLGIPGTEQGGSGPTRAKPEQIDVDVRIEAPIPLAVIEANSKAVDVSRFGEAGATLSRTPRGVIDAGRDLEIAFSYATDGVMAGLSATFDPVDDAGYFSLLVEPPTELSERTFQPREMVFLLDCSGSMMGPPFEASKAFVRRALSQLRATDTFRIIRFSNHASELSETPLKADAEGLAMGLSYLDALEIGGGTMMTSGIERALSPPREEGRLRIITFLTDGHIGNDFEVIRSVSALIGESRIYAVGVGSNINRYLLEEVARMGRGFARFLDPASDMTEQAELLSAKLQNPILTNVAIDGDGLFEVTPNPVPDLFAGDSVRVLGRYARPGPQRIVVSGDTASGRVEFLLDVDLPASRSDGDAIRLNWARHKIAERMRAALASTEQDATLEADVTALGLRHSLITQWTSFIAESHRPLQIPGYGGPGTRGRGGDSQRGMSISHLRLLGGGGSGYGKGAGDFGERHARTAKIVPGKPAVQGSLDKEIIRRVVRQHRREVKYCYETQLAKDANLKGKIVVRFTISPTGAVVSAVVKESTVKNDAVHDCLVRKLKRWAFPEPKGGGTVIVTYPFSFSR